MPAERPLQPFATFGPAFLPSDDPWRFDLGEVAAGTPLPSLQLGLRNASEEGHTLSVSFGLLPEDPAFRLFLDPSNFTGIGPDTGRGAIVVLFDAAAPPGRHEATLTLQLWDETAGTALPDITLTLAETVVGTLAAGTIPERAYTITGYPAAFTAEAHARQVASTPLLLDGAAFARIAFLGSWSSSGDLRFAPTEEEVRDWGPNYLLATFQGLQADLTEGGVEVRRVSAVGIGAGALATGEGGQEVLWSFADAGHAAIATGAGDDAVTVTATGLDGTEDALPSLLPYAVYPHSLPRGGPVYDGEGASATVEAGPGNDRIALGSMARTTLLLRPGDGEDLVVGFRPGTDAIVFHGIDPAAVRAEALDGGAGLRFRYGAAGEDSITLQGVAALRPGDLSYAEVPEAPAPAPPTDWNALAAQAMANFAATGRWFVSPAGGEDGPPPPAAVDWDALAAEVWANFAATGQWYV